MTTSSLPPAGAAAFLAGAGTSATALRFVVFLAIAFFGAIVFAGRAGLGSLSAGARSGAAFVLRPSFPKEPHVPANWRRYPCMYTVFAAIFSHVLLPAKLNAASSVRHNYKCHALVWPKVPGVSPARPSRAQELGSSRCLLRRCMRKKTAQMPA